jgi:hypothetical protein
MDPWKTFVISRFSPFLEADSFFYSGRGKERFMVR